MSNRRRCIEPDVCNHILSYNNLKDKPQINGVQLMGNKTAKDLGLQSSMLAITVEQIETIFKNY